jgi:hypothetical protein
VTLGSGWNVFRFARPTIHDEETRVAFARNG